MGLFLPSVVTQCFAIALAMLRVICTVHTLMVIDGCMPSSFSLKKLLPTPAPTVSSVSSGSSLRYGGGESPFQVLDSSSSNVVRLPGTKGSCLAVIIGYFEHFKLFLQKVLDLLLTIVRRHHFEVLKEWFHTWNHHVHHTSSRHRSGFRSHQKDHLSAGNRRTS